MTDTVKAFIELVDNLEREAVTYYAMPREMMIALRDELKEKGELWTEQAKNQ